MQSAAIIVLCIVAACAYGIVHDQVTARICIEYFTVGHPQILTVPTDSPTVLGFVWGIVATWWVGFGLGIPLALVARFGKRPKRSVGDLFRPVGVLLIVTGMLAVAAGVMGSALAVNGWVFLSGPIAERVPAEHHVGFLADLFAHNMSYFAGSIGGVALIVKTWRSRGQ
jgi:hypothetical protein